MKWIILGLIRLYQVAISPMTPASCRFVPTCSAYCYEAFKRHGALRGGFLSIVRLLKCGPWHHGGFDPVPDKK